MSIPLNKVKGSKPVNGKGKELAERDQEKEVVSKGDVPDVPSTTLDAQETKHATLLTAMEYSEVPTLKVRPFYWQPSFLLLVVLPIVLGSLYFGVVATDRYVSHTQLTVRSAGGGATSMLGGLIGAVGGGGATTSEAYIIQDYIKSRDILADLQDTLDIKSIYGKTDADYLSRLNPDASNEDLYEHFLNRTEVFYDPSTQIVTVNVEAFSPMNAQTIATAIVSLCDELVNRIAQDSRKDALHFASIEVDRAENRVEAVRMALNAFRLKHGELDPVIGASTISAIVASIEGELVKMQTELTALRSYLRDDSAQVVAAQSRVRALKKQLSIERARLAGPQSKGTYIPLLAEYERLNIKDLFAKEAYKAAGAALEIARGEANRKHLYLVAFVKPSLPDTALQPERARMIFTVIICSILFYGLFSLLAAAIREHARV